MTFIVSNRHDNAARASLARGGVDLANAVTATWFNRVMSSGAIAQSAGTPQSVKSTATITYTINGIFATKAATDPLWTLSGTVVPVSSFQSYLLLLDSVGTATVQEGTASIVNAAGVNYLNVSRVSSYAPLLTVLQAGKVVAGYIQVATDATHPFTPGTTSLTATGITTTFFNGTDQAACPLLANEQGLIIGLGV